MRGVAAKNLLDALKQARGVGLVEESFVLKGGTPEEDCSLVVRNLTPDEYESVMAECQGHEEMAYLNAFQRGHVSRAIVEVNGFDLRDVGFIEDEVEDPKRQGVMKKVRVERHKWLDENIIRTWSKESLFTAYRKVGDVVAKAESLAKEGVSFLVSDETPHDHLRRLLLEAKELESDISPEMLANIFNDFDLIRKEAPQHYQAAAEKLEGVAPPVEAQEASQSPLEAPQSVPEVPPAPVPPPSPKPVQEAPEAILRRRVPLNQGPVEIPVPVAPDEAPPAPIRRDDYAATRESQASLGLDMGNVPAIPVPPTKGEVAEIGPRAKFDPGAALQLIDQPPPAGINARFRPPGR